MNLITERGHDFGEVASALQKAIRRGDGRLAGYWAVELLESGFGNYLWKRLLTVSAEDCWGILTQEVWSLFEAHQLVAKGRKGKTRIFVAKAVLLLCAAKKSRDADHLTNLVYDAKAISNAELEADLVAVRGNLEPIPDYALDVHTYRGRKKGRTKADFFREEFAALKPREPGLFDKEVKQSRK